MKEYKVITMYSEELEREIRVSVYLPKSYEKTDKLYPVLYMHDGQNLFDNKLATYGKSWGIIEAFEKDLTLPEVIVVGIDSIDTRTEELVPFIFSYEDDEDLHGGNSDNYYKFITETLKSFIDKKYRTLKSSNSTGIMGSSYGGLSSLYAALKYSEFFTRFGCVSNAFFPVQKDLEELVKNSSLSLVKKFYMDVGTKESSTDVKNELYVTSNQSIFNLLSKKIEPDKLKFRVIKEAIHNESAWEIRFPEIIKFLFSD